MVSSPSGERADGVRFAAWRRGDWSLKIRADGKSANYAFDGPNPSPTTTFVCKGICTQYSIIAMLLRVFVLQPRSFLAFAFPSVLVLKDPQKSYKLFGRGSAIMQRKTLAIPFRSQIPKSHALWRGLVRGAPEKPKSPGGRMPSGEIFLATDLANRRGGCIFGLTTVLVALAGFPVCGRFNKCCGNKKGAGVKPAPCCFYGRVNARRPNKL